MTKCTGNLTYLTIAIFVSSVVGCGGGPSGPPAPTGPKGTVKAKVVHDGKPVTKGVLTLDSGKGFVATAKAAADGTFELKGPQGDQIPVGTYKVGIAPESTPPGPGSTAMNGPPKLEGIPEKFYGTLMSGVTVEIKEGKQEPTIELK